MKKANIIGAGLVGSLWAVYMAKRGYDVDVYEYRSDFRDASFVGGRSINLALSNRGWRALDKVGISEDIKKVAIPSEFIGKDYTNDPVFKEHFQSWLNTLWCEKDEFINQIKSDNNILY